MTSFDDVYNVFLSKITEDMYLEWTEEDTIRDLRSILMEALPLFEFPKFNTNDIEDESFTSDLDEAEIDIIATLMVWSWIKRQVASCENIRMKYGGSIWLFHSVTNVKIL